LPDDFYGLGLSAKVTDAVTAAGYTKPTEIQAQAIPHVLNKQDIIGIAQTGTGKTASFVLPMLTLLESGRARARMPRTLILEPTRELAAQVAENFEKYGKNHRLTMALLIGGVSFEEQNKVLDRGADVLIATPGRMLDQYERGRILLNGVDILVIDEADRMLDMGFIPDIERICSLLPPRRQTLFFSATMPPEIERLTKRFLRDPVRLEVARKNSVVETIDQRLIRVSSKPEEKRATLRQLIRGADALTNAIIFCNRKRDVATLARSLQRHGFSAGELHGDMDQKNRTETLDAFKTNKLTLLVASDVAARGLDIPAVSHVFNFDVPTHAEDYIHRIGRTGRAGRLGTSLTLAAPADGKYLDAIVKLIQKDIPLMVVEGSPAGEVSEAGDEPRGESRSRSRGRSRHTGDGKTTRETAEARPPREKQEPRPPREAQEARAPREQQQPRPQREPQEARAPREKTEARPPRERAEQRPRNERPVNKPERVAEYASDTPFGSDGPVPAFLLRPGVAR
jgi:superfamily II DNA/RNA helicase